MVNKGKAELDRKINQFKQTMRETLGDVIRKPIPARLGYLSDEGQIFLEVDEKDADQPKQFYFSNAGGQSFVGQAYLQDGAIAEWQLRYGAPIRILKDPLNATWQIVGLDVIYSSEFFDGVDPEDVAIVPLRRFEPGLLTSTIPQSMKARVLGGAYDIGDTFAYYDSQDTIDWSTPPHESEIPQEGQSRFVLVQLDPNDGSLSYKYGSPVSASLDFIQAYRFQVNSGINFILPNKDTGQFRVGYIKLSGGMTSIDRRENIWAIQQVLGAANSSTDIATTLLPRIVTDGESVVVSDGEVVWIEEDEIV